MFTTSSWPLSPLFLPTKSSCLFFGDVLLLSEAGVTRYFPAESRLVLSGPVASYRKDISLRKNDKTRNTNTLSALSFSYNWSPNSRPWLLCNLRCISCRFEILGSCAVTEINHAHPLNDHWVCGLTGYFFYVLGNSAALIDIRCKFQKLSIPPPWTGFFLRTAPPPTSL